MRGLPVKSVVLIIILCCKVLKMISLHGSLRPICPVFVHASDLQDPVKMA
jgi:hypothetical protein